MTFQQINILPADKSTWQVHKGFEIVPGTNLGYFRWKYGGKTSTDMKLFDAVAAANNYAEELNLVARINNPPQIKIENAGSELSPSERKDYEMSLLSYLENLGRVKIDSFLKKVNITDAGFNLHKKYSK